jgi:hypothetical protein
MVQSVTDVYARLGAIDRFNSRRKGSAARRTQQLYLAACKGLSGDQIDQLNNHVLALFGYPGAQQITTPLSREAQAWVDWMLQ